MSDTSARQSADWCDQKWLEISGRHDASAERDYTVLLRKWREMEVACKGTGVFEVRLASIHLMLGDYEEVRRALQGAVVTPQYVALAETVRLNATFFEVLSSGNEDVRRIRAIEREATKISGKYPEHLPLYSLIGHLRLLLEDYPGAIAPLENATRQRDGDLVGPLRNLTIAYAKTGKYERSISVGDRAYSLYHGVTSDERYMYALAISYAAIGNIEASKDTLNLILNKKPNLQHDAEFESVVRRAKELSGGKLK